MWDRRSKILAGMTVVLALFSAFLLLRNRALSRKVNDLEVKNRALEIQNDEARRRAKTLEDLLVAFDISFSKSLRPETEPKLDELVKSFGDPNIEKEWQELRSVQGAKLKPEFLVVRVRNVLLAIVASIQTALKP